jgi:hypothetical protein
MSYRNIYEKEHGNIPEGYEIHHIDGNRNNNAIENLLAVSIEQHYDIHLSQGDYLACAVMTARMNMTKEERKEIHKLAMSNRDQYGNKNPMYGRSAIVENNMKWYNDGKIETMFTEGKELPGYFKGRLYYPIYDKKGSKNPRARKASVNGKIYDCLKDATKDYPHVPYSTLKMAARNNKRIEKYDLEVRYEV